MKNKFAITIDNILVSLTIFVLTYLWIERFIKKIYISLILSILCSILIFFILEKRLIKKYKYQKFSFNEKKLLDEITNILATFSENENTSYFEKLLCIKKVSKNIYQNEKCYFYINFSQKLSSFDYFYANNFYIESDKTKPICFLTNGTTAEFNDLISSSMFKYLIFTLNDLFVIIKSKNLFPKSITKKINVKKQSKFLVIKNNIKEAITKARFKEFFFSGLSLVAISIFVPYSLYYLISGTIFLIISILCLIVKKSSNEPIKNVENLSDFLLK